MLAAAAVTPAVAARGVLVAMPGFLGGAGSFDPLARALPGYGLTALAVFVCAFLALAVFLWKRAWAVRTTERVIGLVSKGLARFLATKVSDVADGLKTLADPRLAFGFVLETTLYWASNAVGMWILAQGCGLELSLGQAVGVMGILAIGILLPAGPGLFGSFQLAVSLALQLFFASEIVTGVGAVYVFLLFTIQAVGIVLAGVIPLLSMRLKLADLMPRLDGFGLLREVRKDRALGQVPFILLSAKLARVRMAPLNEE